MRTIPYALLGVFLALPGHAYWQIDTSPYWCEATYHSEAHAPYGRGYASGGGHVRLRSDAMTRQARIRDFPESDPTALVLEFSISSMHHYGNAPGSFPGDGRLPAETNSGYPMKVRLFPGAGFQDIALRPYDVPNPKDQSHKVQADDAWGSEFTWTGFDRHAELPKAKAFVVKWVVREPPPWQSSERAPYWRSLEFEFPTPPPRILNAMNRCVERLREE